MVNYIIQSVSSKLKLERRCPHYHRPNANVHTAIHYRPVSDIKVTKIPQRRIKCPWCKTTWTIRAEGLVPEDRHKICLAHRRKSKCRRAWQLYRQLKAEGFEFESRDMLRLQHTERTWQKVGSDEGDRTNNLTERIIGLDYKLRAKTMRGFKSSDKVLAHPYLSEYLRGVDGVCDPRKVV